MKKVKHVKRTTEDTADIGFFPLVGGLLLGGGALALSGCGGDTTVASPPIQPILLTPPAPTPAPVVSTETINTNLTVYRNGVDYYQSGMYMAINNTWGADKFGMAYGKDYSQTITYNKASFPAGVTFNWDYPDAPHGDGAIVYGFPSVAFGNTALPLSGYNLNGSIAQIKDITKFVQTFDVTLKGDLQYMNLMSDVWLFDSTGKVAGEITFSVYPDAHIRYWSDPNNFFGQQTGAHMHQITMGDVNYNILVSNTYGSDSKVIMISPAGDTQNIHGTIDWHQLFDLLDNDMDINPDWFVKGVEMGVEVQAGNGSMHVNDFHVAMTYLDHMTNSYVTIG